MDNNDKPVFTIIPIGVRTIPIANDPEGCSCAFYVQETPLLSERKTANLPRISPGRHELLAMVEAMFIPAQEGEHCGYYMRPLDDRFVSGAVRFQTTHKPIIWSDDDQPLCFLPPQKALGTLVNEMDLSCAREGCYCCGCNIMRSMYADSSVLKSYVSDKARLWISMCWSSFRHFKYFTHVYGFSMKEILELEIYKIEMDDPNQPAPSYLDLWTTKYFWYIVDCSREEFDRVYIDRNTSATYGLDPRYETLVNENTWEIYGDYPWAEFEYARRLDHMTRYPVTEYEGGIHGSPGLLWNDWRESELLTMFAGWSQMFRPHHQVAGCGMFWHTVFGANESSIRQSMTFGDMAREAVLLTPSEAVRDDPLAGGAVSPRSREVIRCRKCQCPMEKNFGVWFCPSCDHHMRDHPSLPDFDAAW